MKTSEIEKKNNIDSEQVWDYIVYSVNLIFSNTLLNILIGVIGGLVINLYSSDPNQSIFYPVIYWLSSSVFLSIILIFFNDLLASSRPNLRERPTLLIKYSVENIHEQFNWPIKLIYLFYLLLTLFYLLGIGVGIYKFQEASTQIDKFKEIESRRFPMIENGVSEIKAELKMQNEILVKLTDSIRSLSLQRKTIKFYPASKEKARSSQKALNLNK